MIKRSNLNHVRLHKHRTHNSLIATNVLLFILALTNDQSGQNKSKNEKTEMKDRKHGEFKQNPAFKGSTIVRRADTLLSRVSRQIARTAVFLGFRLDNEESGRRV